ncbi:Eco57I restriction-modification methylase domain-containing protein [Ilumatobacter sp.]|uniref:Eco57I restriction-modification methylase domain-containing protein n=1 Tax=Ilumatobacter sp. TaxID=1967498 RepID=UPI003B52ECC2
MSSEEAPSAEPRHVPDVLETLAQLPNDEVFTPPKLANAMLDILPDQVWHEPKFKWLDPATKSGVFLREAYKRLMIGLAAWQPDPGQRRRHILRNMLYGSAITTLSADIARRSVYQTKDATGASVVDSAITDWVVEFGTEAGNIEYSATEHTIGNDGRCEICRAPEALVRDKRETYAYAFNHGTYPTQEMEDMKFDVIVGNPPYQISAEGTNRTMPIYQQFVERAIDMDPKYVLMITPSRWFTGGLGLDEFRDRMINDRRLAKVVDNPKIFDCFPQAKIRGGVSYFLWDRDHDGDCEVSTRIDGTVVSSAVRDLRRGHGVLVRDNKASSIVEKVLAKEHESIEDWFLPRLAFNQNWRTNYRGESTEPADGRIPLIHNSGIGYVRMQDFERNEVLVGEWKVLLPMASSGDTAQDESGRIVDVVLGEPIAVQPGSVCTESYFVAGTPENREACQHYAHYLATKFVRFLVLQRKSTQHITSDRFRFVPALTMSRRWTDSDLYDRFGLDGEEIAHIEASIKPRSVNLSLDSPVPASHLPGGRKHKATGGAADQEAGDE